MNLRNWRIGSRLAAGFGISLTILIATVAATYIVSADGRDALAGHVERSEENAAAIADMQRAVLEAQVAMQEAGLHSGGDAAGIHRRVEAHFGTYVRARARLADVAASAGKPFLSDADVAMADLRRDHKAWTTQAVAWNEVEAKVHAAARNATAAIGRLSELQRQESRRQLREDADRSKYIIGWLAAICAFAVATGSMIAWRLTASITRPLQSAVSIARRVANGDLTSQPVVEGKDEVSELLGSLKAMNDNLRRLVGEVRQGADSIATASKEIAAGNADLSTRTETQAQSLGETATTMEKLTATVTQNAGNAGMASEAVLKSSMIAGRGGEVVREVVETMEQIKSSSRRIADIIGVIDAIAFQTNILALNAAVEAARAGEEGRGFAVVASEVRTLAQRSAAAAREIKELITGSVEKVDAGGRLVAHAGETMNEIVASVRGVTAIIDDIASAGREQAAGIEEVNCAVAQMDEMTQRNAALVEQAAAAAQSMEEQTRSLAKAVCVFRLESNGAEAIDMVRRAVAFISEHGAEAALAAFNKPVPAFKDRDLYINVIDFKGNTLAHGGNIQQVGKNTIDLKDSDGKPFIREFVRVAGSLGAGWIDYRWLNPVTMVVDVKTTYVERAGDLIIGCGIYK